jgi:chromosome segregation ATPase
MLRNGQRLLDETRAKSTALQTRVDEGDAALQALQARVNEGDTALKALQLRAAHLEVEHASAVKDLEVRCARLEAQGEIADATLAEARSLLGVERARGDLFHDELDEATQTLARERARGDLFRADLEEAQLALGRMRQQLKDVREHELEVQETLNNISKSAEGEALRSDALQAQVDEAQQQFAAERHRSELLQAQLDEAQHAAARAAARAAELSGQLDDAQETFLLRRAAHQGDLDRLVGHRLAEQSATQRIVDDLMATAAAAEAARVATAAHLRAAEDAVATKDAERVATAARLRAAEDAHRGLAEQLALLAAEGGATAELRSLNESLQAEIQGLRSSLELAREDISTLENQQQAQQAEAVMLAREELILITAERDQLKENVALDVEARSKAEDARDAANAAKAAAEESAAAESRRRQELEAELARLRAEAKASGSLIEAANAECQGLLDVAEK